jgi:hypothetical protein
MLSNKWVIEEIKEEIKKFWESNENENTTYQNPWDTEKSVLTKVIDHVLNCEVLREWNLIPL